MYGGKIAANDVTLFGGKGGVYVDGGSFTMNNGEISGNKAGNGGGVYVNSGSFTMNGGNISGNGAAASGSGVYQGGTMSLSGAPVIGNNKNSNSQTPDNLYLPNGKTVTVGVTGLTGAASIAVLSETQPADETLVNITGANIADYSAFFTSDKGMSIVNSAEGVVQISAKAPTPVHSHGIAVSGGEQSFRKVLTSQDGALYIDGARANSNEFGYGYELPAGAYYLGGDIALDNQLLINGETKLCFDGYDSGTAVPLRSMTAAM